jgi:hypothetical protein
VPSDLPIPPFVGREVELSWLRALWDEAAAPGHADVMPAARQVDIVPALVDCAELRRRQERFDEAETLLREAVGVARGRGDDPRLVYPLWRLGGFLAARKRTDEALAVLTEGVEFGRRVLGPGHPRTVAFEETITEVTGGDAGT